MKNAIKINLKKADEKYDLGTSKFFGDPTVPAEWADRFAEDVIFLCQIELSNIAELDKENRLPHKGYLYFFLDTECYPYDAWIEYYGGEPDTVLENFNSIVPEFEHLNEAFIMSFEECEEIAGGTRLFGVPSSGYEPDGSAESELLMQFDPLEIKTGFLDHIDGYAYIFYNTKKTPIEGAAQFVIDRS